jgi:NADH-quinone oxidoreductase subunit N
MSQILSMMIPELILSGTACFLFLLGCSRHGRAGPLAPGLALAAILAALATTWKLDVNESGLAAISDQMLRINQFAWYLRILSLGVAAVLLLLAWNGSNHSSLNVGEDSGEFYALFLFSITGLLLAAGANDLVLLFLALELVSIPTYVMVSISRPRAVAQEAGVKYFFLGAMSAALMLFGFSYLYGATGEINFVKVNAALRAAMDANHGVLPAWHKLGIVLLIAGFAFKIAAFPMHFYVGDVYEGAATPVTAFLAFVPKTAGFAALIKLLYIAGYSGANYALPTPLPGLLAAMAALTMTIGNVLGLLQSSVKRVMAYSSVAHSGYMLVGLTAMSEYPEAALSGVLFYLAAYGLMNAGVFGVLILLPSRDGRSSAETFDDLIGQGRRRPLLALAMAISCFSLIGLPLTVGFMGKLLLVQPALLAQKTPLVWLVVLTMINAAISAAYYLRIIATMFLRNRDQASDDPEQIPLRGDFSARLAVGFSVLATLGIGSIPQVTQVLQSATMEAAGAAVWQALPVLPLESEPAENNPLSAVDR